VIADAPTVRGLALPRPRLLALRDFVLRPSVLLFAVAYAVYAGLGLYTTLRLHLVLGDAQSRLANAYLALWNVPAKLTAIGFFWPPLQTLVLIPFAAVKPLATSNAALPLSSALFAAGTVVVVDRTLALSRIHPVLRLALVAAFALNPLILFYGGNGMAESLYLFLLTAAVAVFVRWLLAPRWYHLLNVGFLLALAVLGRFEIAFWLPVLAAGIALVSLLRGARYPSVEGSLLVVLVPAAYGFLLWMGYNWIIVGDPVAFLRAGLGVAGAAGFVSAPVSHRLASGAAAGATGAWQALRLQFEIFPATYIVAGALAVFALVRRSVAAAVLSALVLVNAVSAALWAAAGGVAIATHLRYNQRAMPLALVAVGWLLVVLPARWRTWTAAAALVIVAGSIPLTIRTMLHYHNAQGEHVYIKALETGKSQDDVPKPAGTGIPVRQAEHVASYIRGHVQGRDVILADNAQTFGVILADGHPDRYYDRIDFGDKKWLVARDKPIGRAHYLLVWRLVSSAGFAYDLIAARYPSLLGNGRRLRWPPFIRSRVYSTQLYALFSVYPNAVTWAKREWYTMPSLAAFLKRHGSSWEAWSAAHRSAARALEAQSSPSGRPAGG
jgi:hypothetical protein